MVVIPCGSVCFWKIEKSRCYTAVQETLKQRFSHWINCGSLEIVVFLEMSVSSVLGYASFSGGSKTECGIYLEVLQQVFVLWIDTMCGVKEGLHEFQFCRRLKYVKVVFFGWRFFSSCGFDVAAEWPPKRDRFVFPFYKAFSLDFCWWWNHAKRDLGRNKNVQV